MLDVINDIPRTNIEAFYHWMNDTQSRFISGIVGKKIPVSYEPVEYELEGFEFVCTHPEVIGVEMDCGTADPFTCDYIDRWEYKTICAECEEIIYE